MPRKVILDVDTGSDDAVALCAAALSPDIELVAACTVWGNQPIENTTDNTLRLFDALGIDGTHKFVELEYKLVYLVHCFG